jgi:hypothetical protein
MAAAGDAGLRASGAGAGAGGWGWGAGWRLALEEGVGVGVGVRREVEAPFSPAAPGAAPAGGGPQRDLRADMPAAGDLAGGLAEGGGLEEAEGFAGG